MKVLIIEDELAATKRLHKLLMEIDRQIEVVGQLESIEDSVNWLMHPLPVDLIFMDIHLADGSCFDIFSYIKVDKPIIFTTAYDQYAIQAFRVNAIDYLLKPIKKAALEQALNKLKELKSKENEDYQRLLTALQHDQAPKRFLVRVGRNVRLVNMKEVAYFFSKNKITYLVDGAGRKHPVDQPLEQLEEILDSKLFFRVNRQFIINVNAIKEMHSVSKSRLKIDLDPHPPEDVIVSVERSPRFKKWLTGA